VARETGTGFAGHFFQVRFGLMLMLFQRRFLSGTGGRGAVVRGPDAAGDDQKAAYNVRCGHRFAQDGDPEDGPIKRQGIVQDRGTAGAEPGHPYIPGVKPEGRGDRADIKQA